MINKQKLKFNLKASESSIYGKQRMFFGEVLAENNDLGTAAMMIGENGFDLTYTLNNQVFGIKNKEKLDLGHEDYETIKNKRKKTKQQQFSPIIEGKHYDLIDLRNHRAKRLCRNETILDSFKNKDNNTSELNSTKALNTPYTYYLYNLYMDYSFYYPYSLLYLSQSLKDIDSRIRITVQDHPLKTQAKRGHNQNLKQAYERAVLKNNNAYQQLNAASNFLRQYRRMGQVPSRKSATMLLYEYSWNEGINGLANRGTYAQSSGWKKYQSVFIARDDLSTTLAHEAGHNLGANHSSYTFGLMYPSGSFLTSQYHKSASNKATIRMTLSR